MDKNYGNVIWTNHSLKRMGERGIKQSDAWATWKNPDHSNYAKTKGAWVYHKLISGEKIEIVAKKNSEGKWVILSVWSKPVPQKNTNTKKRFSFVKLIRGVLRA